MATGKKYYWIKLRKDFMTGDIVDFLMGQRNGAQYVVLYQMLCLMCINTNGELARQIGEVMIPFDVDKIYRDCKYFSRDTVTIALELFKKLGLLYEQESGGLIISGFENLIGCETDYAKQKRVQRQSRQAQRQIPDNGEDSSKDDNVDNVQDSVSCVVSDSSIQSKSIEKEYRVRDKSIERDTEKDESIITVSNETVRQTDVRRIVDAWNGLQGYGIKPISKISSNSKRFQSLVARMKQYSTTDILLAIDKIKQSDFLQGKSNSGWMITFDWFVLPNNFPKVLEGNYDKQGMAGNQTQKHDDQYQSKTSQMLEQSYGMMSEWARKKDMEEHDNDN